MVSVVIPVYNDAGPLEVCLQALSKQTYPGKKYEVLVVDNNSDEDISSVVTWFEGAEVVYESKQGSYAARNQGIRKAKGEVIAFTDADCVPSRIWIERGVDRLTEDDACGLVGGRIIFSFQTSNQPSPPELFDSTHFLDQEHYVRTDDFAATANAFTWNRVFEKVGEFDETLQSGGDTEWGHRVSEYGYEICYSADAVVNHPARQSYRAVRKKKLRVLQGTTRSRTEKGYPLWELGIHVLKDLGHHAKFVLLVVWTKEYSFLEKVRAFISFSLQGMSTAMRRMQFWYRSHHLDR